MGEMHVEIRVGELHVERCICRTTLVSARNVKQMWNRIYDHMQQNNLLMLLHLSDVVEVTFADHMECESVN